MWFSFLICILSASRPRAWPEEDCSQVCSLAMNIETKLTHGKGLIQVKNLTGEAIERAVNLTKEAIGNGPEFTTGGSGRDLPEPLFLAD